MIKAHDTQISISIIFTNLFIYKQLFTSYRDIIAYYFLYPQYIPQALHDRKLPVFERFAVIFSIVIVWFYAYLLTIGGTYRHDPPKTQVHCRTDRSGLVGGAPW